MAKAINRSTVAVEMYGVETDSATKRRVLLPPGRQSADGFNVRALRAPEGGSVEIFEEEEWWAVHTPEVHLYEFTPLSWSFTKNVTLHCIPPQPGANGFARGYEKPSQPLKDEIDAVVFDPSLNLHREPETPQGAKDNELNSTHKLFGKFVRTGSHICVRLDLTRLFGVHASTLEDQKHIWKQTIEEVWNAAPTTKTFTFECDFTDKSAHYTVRIVESLPSKLRASMFIWPIDLHPHVAAHEYGHYLGLTDSYLYDGELPHLMKDVIATLPKFKNKAASMETLYSLWTNLARLWPSNEERAKKRLRPPPDGGKWTSGDVDIMWSSFIDGTANRTITPNLVKTIDRVGDADFDTQDLFWRESDFEKKEADGALAFVKHEDG
jgi:hypothetical protein